MIQSTGFVLLSVRLVAFTQHFGEKMRSASALSKILPQFASWYDGPIEAPSPPQVSVSDGKLTVTVGEPQCIRLVSQDRRLKFEITDRRVDSHWRQQSDDDRTRSVSEVCKECLSPLLEYPFDADKVQISRLAIVVSRWYPCQNPSHLLSEHFCQPQLTDDSDVKAPLRHSQGFRLDNLKRFPSPIPDVMVNSWVRCASDKTLDQASGIRVEHDLNTDTLQTLTPTAEFNSDDARTFFTWAPIELGKILALYFPGTQK